MLLLNALYIPDSGTVTVDGLDTKDEDNVWKIRQKVGIVFQNPDNQIVATSVEEDVAFGPENLGLSSLEIAKRIDRSLKWLGWSSLENGSLTRYRGDRNKGWP